MLGGGGGRGTIFTLEKTCSSTGWRRLSLSSPNARSIASRTEDLPVLLSPMKTAWSGSTSFAELMPRKFSINTA